MQANSCPHCGAPLPPCDISVTTDLALCRACGQVTDFARFREAARLEAVDLAAPPRHVTVRLDPSGARQIVYRRVSPLGLLMAPGAAVLAFFVGRALFRMLRVPGELNVESLPLFAAFAVAAIALACAATYFAFGRWVITLDQDSGDVFAGVGRTGWRRRFTCDCDSYVALELSSVEVNDERQTGMAVHTHDERIIFGALWTDRAKEYIAAAIHAHIADRRRAAVAAGASASVTPGTPPAPCPPCRQCGAALPLEDVHVARDLALCRACGWAGSFALLSARDALVDVDIAEPPRRVTVHTDPLGTLRIVYRRVLPSVWMCAGLLVWIGLSLAMAYHIPALDGMWGFVARHARIALLVSAAVLLGVTAYLLLGRWVLTLAQGRGVVSAGVGPFGWRRRFECDHESHVALEPSNTVVDGVRQRVIAITTRGATVTFGARLEPAARRYLAAIVHHHIAGRRRAAGRAAEAAPPPARACPHCGVTVALDDVDVPRDTAHCRACGETSSLALLCDIAGLAAVDLTQPPRRVRVRTDPRGSARIECRRVLPAVRIVAPFTLLAGGGALWLIYDRSCAGGVFDIARFLLVIPFTIIAVVLLCITVYTLFGRWVITLAPGRGTVFTGVGPLGWRRRFEYDRHSHVSVQPTDDKVNDEPLTGVVVHAGTKRLAFGTLLSDEAKRFVAAVVRDSILKSPRPTAETGRADRSSSG